MRRHHAAILIDDLDFAIGFVEDLLPGFRNQLSHARQVFAVQQTLHQRFFAVMQCVVVMRHQIADVGRRHAHLGLVKIDREHLGHQHHVGQVAVERDQRAFRRHQDGTFLAQLLEERQRLAFHPAPHQRVFLGRGCCVVFLEIIPRCSRHSLLPFCLFHVAAFG